ncbi:catalase core domain-containing protein, partial [Apiosordaria backusii]
SNRCNSPARLQAQGRGALAPLEDTQLIETLAYFPRERIPERVVHAKAAGAWCEFECTHDVSDFTSAAFLNNAGKKTKVLARLSTVAGEKGSSDTTRDIRGLALKMVVRGLSTRLLLLVLS